MEDLSQSNIDDRRDNNLNDRGDYCDRIKLNHPDFSILLDSANARQPLFFNSYGQAVLLDHRIMPAKWLIIDLKIRKTYLDHHTRFILDKNGQLWSIKYGKLRVLHTSRIIVDFLICKDKLYYLTYHEQDDQDKKYQLYLRINGRTDHLIHDNVTSLPNSVAAVDFLAVNTANRAILYIPNLRVNRPRNRINNNVDNMINRRMDECLELDTDDVRIYIEEIYFSLIVTVTDQLLVIDQSSLGNSMMMFLSDREIRNCPRSLRQYGKNSLELYDVSAITEVRNICRGSTQINGISYQGLFYLDNDRLNFHCPNLTERINEDVINKTIERIDNRPIRSHDLQLQDLIIINGICYARNLEGLIYSFEDLEKPRLLNPCDSLSFHSIRMARVKACKS